MCYYIKITYLDCPHTNFEIDQLCYEVLNQLQRIYNPQESEDGVPFDVPDCRPNVVHLVNGGNIRGERVNEGSCFECLRGLVDN